MKKVPSYWWDFHGKDMVIVESDSDRFPVVGIFHYDPQGGRKPTGELAKDLHSLGILGRVGTADDAIKEAERLIADLEAGRVTPTAKKFT